jgi:predicted Zn-dependent protease
VAVARETDALPTHADALAALAEVFRLAGRPDEAGEAAEAAVRLYRKKGNVVSARRVSAFIRQARHVRTV